MNHRHGHRDKAKGGLRAFHLFSFLGALEAIILTYTLTEVPAIRILGSPFLEDMYLLYI